MYQKVIMMGRLAADPELRQTPSGVSVATFAIAVDRQYADKDGKRQADFFDIVAWRELGEFVSKYFHKGKPCWWTAGSKPAPTQTRTGSSENFTK